VHVHLREASAPDDAAFTVRFSGTGTVGRNGDPVARKDNSPLGGCLAPATAGRRRGASGRPLAHTSGVA